MKRYFSRTIFRTIGATKYLAVMIIASLITSISLPAIASPPNSKFSDVSSSHWASKQIKTLANWKVIDGEVSGKYKPDGNLRRSELAKLLSLSLIHI
jgi:hypothetical protein